MMLLAVIAVGAIGLSFSQLGLVGIGAPGEYLCYAVTLIAPVALAALLLGMVQGAFIGLVAGGALFVHSSVQPLDFYEIVFVTPLSSIAFLAVLGTVFGALFYLVLRRGATGMAPAWSASPSCASWEWRCSGGRSRRTGTYVLSGYFAEGVGTMSPEQWFASMGNVWVQTAVEAVATVIVCLVVDAIARRAIAAANAMSFRTTFRAWLLGVVVIAFVITGAVSFAIITEQEKASAYDTMGDEANYLCMQLEEARVRTDALDSYLEKADIDPEADLEIAVSIGVVKAVLSADTLLDGYSLEYDGIVMIIQDGIVIMSDDPEAPNGTPVGEVFDESVTSWFDEAASTGVMGAAHHHPPNPMRTNRKAQWRPRRGRRRSCALRRRSTTPRWWPCPRRWSFEGTRRHHDVDHAHVGRAAGGCVPAGVVPAHAYRRAAHRRNERRAGAHHGRRPHRPRPCARQPRVRVAVPTASTPR